MTHSFNLIHEPWLPVAYAGEPQTREVGLREALLDAHRIRELVDPSPLVTVALHRLLLAVLHRAVGGPATDDDWVDIWNAGAFDSGCLDDYFDRCRECFDLFHPERPFYQTPGIPERVATTVAKLGHEFAAGNNPLLFDHSLDADPPALRPAEAARLLVAHQAFALSGTATGLGAAGKDYPDQSHLAGAAVVLVRDRSLFQTLMLNLVRFDGRQSEPFEFDPSADRPAWERDQPTAVPADLAEQADPALSRRRSAAGRPCGRPGRLPVS